MISKHASLDNNHNNHVRYETTARPTARYLWISTQTRLSPLHPQLRTRSHQITNVSVKARITMCNSKVSRLSCLIAGSHCLIRTYAHSHLSRSLTTPRTTLAVSWLSGCLAVCLACTSLPVRGDPSRAPADLAAFPRGEESSASRSSIIGAWIPFWKVERVDRLAAWRGDDRLGGGRWCVAGLGLSFGI